MPRRDMCRNCCNYYDVLPKKKLQHKMSKRYFRCLFPLLTGLQLPPIASETPQNNRKRKIIEYDDEVTVETSVRKRIRRSKGYAAIHSELRREVEKLTKSLQREEERVTEMQRRHGAIQQNLEKEIKELSDWKGEALEEKAELEDEIDRLTQQLQSTQLNNQSLEGKAVQLRTSL